MGRGPLPGADFVGEAPLARSFPFHNGDRGIFPYWSGKNNFNKAPGLPS